jgi:hypothetical protein
LKVRAALNIPKRAVFERLHGFAKKPNGSPIEKKTANSLNH